MRPLSPVRLVSPPAIKQAILRSLSRGHLRPFAVFALTACLWVALFGIAPATVHAKRSIANQSKKSSGKTSRKTGSKKNPPLPQTKPPASHPLTPPVARAAKPTLQKITLVRNVEFPVQFILDNAGNISITGTIINASDSTKYKKLVVIGIFGEFVWTNDVLAARLGPLAGPSLDPNLRIAKGGWQMVVVGTVQNLRVAEQRPIQWQCTLTAKEIGNIPPEVVLLPKDATENYNGPFVLYDQNCIGKFLIMEESSWSLFLKRCKLPLDSVLVPRSTLDDELQRTLMNSVRSATTATNELKY